MHAAPAGQARVVDDLRHAADHARERGAPDTATVLLARALEEPPHEGLRADLLFELGRAELATGRTKAAAAHLEDGFRCAPDPLTRARILPAMAQALPGDPRVRERIGALATATLPEVEALDRDLALRVWAILALEGRPFDDAELTGATVSEATVLGHLVFNRLTPDATAEEVAGLAERAARQTEGLLEEGASALAFTGMVLGLRWAERLEEAQRVLDRAIALARRRGSVTDFGSAMTLRAVVHRRAGRLRDAEADARTVLGAQLDVEWAFARGVVPLVGSLLDQGRAEEADRELAGARLGDEIPDSPPMLPVLLIRMALHLARRRPECALADWEEAAGRVQRTRRGLNAGWIEDLAVVADVHSALAQPAAADAAVEQALALARRWGTPGALGEALHAQARTRGGDDAVETLREAVALLADSPLRLEHARALVALGSRLRRRGQRADSREPLREGYELARRCGATALELTARTELRASGIRLRREALTGADALTPSERRIADLAAGGLANAEIAQELFLTVKTVEMHMTNAYRKLGIGGRAELPAALGAKA